MHWVKFSKQHLMHYVYPITTCLVEVSITIGIHKIRKYILYINFILAFFQELKYG